MRRICCCVSKWAPEVANGFPPELASAPISSRDSAGEGDRPSRVEGCLGVDMSFICNGWGCQGLRGRIASGAHGLRRELWDRERATGVESAARGN